MIARRRTMLTYLLQVTLVVYLLAVLGAALAARKAPEDAVAAEASAAAPVPPAPSADPAPPVPAHVPRAAADPRLAGGRPIVGFALNLHHTDDLDAYLRAVDEIAAMGIAAVEVVTPCYQTDGSADQIAIDVRPGHSPQREDLVRLLNYAHERGMITTLMPIVLFDKPRGSEWRGKLQPEHWSPWWKSYQEVLDYYLDIANETNVSLFSVGSELLSTEGQTERWQELIEHVRSRYDGRLIYSTNWDHFDVPGIWPMVDYIGVSAYWDLTKEAAQDPPTDEELAARWRRIRERVLTFAEAQGKPVILTEVGYPSLPWALKSPWNYVVKPDVAADATAQARGYAAFLKAWGDLLQREEAHEQFAGAFFYVWDPFQEGGAADRGYGIRGKPAHEILRRWLKGR